MRAAKADAGTMVTVLDDFETVGATNLKGACH